MAGLKSQVSASGSRRFLSSSQFANESLLAKVGVSVADGVRCVAFAV